MSGRKEQRAARSGSAVVPRDSPPRKPRRSAEIARRKAQSDAARRRGGPDATKPGAFRSPDPEILEPARLPSPAVAPPRKRPIQSFELGQQEHASRMPNQTRGRSIDRGLQHQARSTASRTPNSGSRPGTARRTGNRHSTH
jgi:hypothetical protein